MISLQGLEGHGYVALVGKTCCDEAFASPHLVLFGLQVPEKLLVQDLLYLDGVHSDPRQQSLTLQERNHNIVWQLTRILVLLPVGPWAATKHALPHLFGIRSRARCMCRRNCCPTQPLKIVILKEACDTVLFAKIQDCLL